MKPKRRRLIFVLLGLAALGIAAGLVLNAFEDSIVFFYSPSDVAERGVEAGTKFRLGGLVAEGSVRTEGTTTHFTVTDLQETMNVAYTGVLPDLFREGQGVITLGTLQADGSFIADQVLAKHDETYMPKEVADSLKDSGHWQDDESGQ